MRSEVAWRGNNDRNDRICSRLSRRRTRWHRQLMPTLAAAFARPLARRRQEAGNSSLPPEADAINYAL